MEVLYYDFLPGNDTPDFDLSSFESCLGWRLGNKLAGCLISSRVFCWLKLNKFTL